MLHTFPVFCRDASDYEVLINNGASSNIVSDFLKANVFYKKTNHYTFRSRNTSIGVSLNSDLTFTAPFTSFMFSEQIVEGTVKHELVYAEWDFQLLLFGQVNFHLIGRRVLFFIFIRA